MEIEINKLKRQLNIEIDYTNDDAILQQYIDVACIAVENYCGEASLSGYTTETIPLPIVQAGILFASHMYMNRNMVSFGSGVEIPYSFRFLLDPYKNYVVQ